jgi:uncharacterized protein YlaI
LNLEVKRAYEKKRRHEAVERRLYFCADCEHAFQTPLGLEKHVKSRSCLGRLTSTPLALAPDMPTAGTAASVAPPIAAAAVQGVDHPVVAPMVRERTANVLGCRLAPAPAATLPMPICKGVPAVPATKTAPNVPTPSVRPVGVQRVGVASFMCDWCGDRFKSQHAWRLHESSCPVTHSMM